MEKTFSASSFEQEVKSTDKPILVDFFANWCGPCKQLSPIVKEIGEEYSDTYVVGKVNVDEEPELSTKFGIVSIPTLLVFKNGNLIDKSVGIVSKDEILEMLDKA